MGRFTWVAHSRRPVTSAGRWSGPGLNGEGGRGWFLGIVAGRRGEQAEIKRRATQSEGKGRRAEPDASASKMPTCQPQLTAETTMRFTAQQWPLIQLPLHSPSEPLPLKRLLDPAPPPFILRRA